MRVKQQLELKQKVKSEMARRRFSGSVAGYAAPSYDYNSPCTDNNFLQGEHLEKNLTTMRAVNPDGLATMPAKVASERLINESDRVDAEAVRSTAEMERTACEELRQDGEEGRAAAESDRALGEEGRASAETKRVAAEEARQTSFSTALSESQTATNLATTAASQAGYKIKGMFATLEELESTVTNPADGDAYFVGTVDSNEVYNWNSITKEWQNVGTLHIDNTSLMGLFVLSIDEFGDLIVHYNESKPAPNFSIDLS